MQGVLLYFKNFLIALDQLFNALLNGSPDETLSSRAYRAYVKDKIFGKIFKPLIDLLFFFDPQHCYTSYLAELNRRQLLPSFKEV